MKRTWRVCEWGIAVGLLLGGGACVAAAQRAFLGPAQPSGPPITSSSQRFVFRGFEAGDGTRLAIWAEDLAGRLERMIGAPIPFRRYEMVRFSAGGEDPANQSRLVLTQGYVENLLHQRIVVVNPHVMEEEELAEGLTKVLLNRYLLGIASRDGVGSGGMSLPDWLSVGMAQNLTTQTQSRNLEFLRAQGEAAVGWDLGQIVTWLELPAGRRAEKAACGLVVSWMDEQVSRTVKWNGVLRRLVSGRDLPLGWLAREALAMEDAEEAEAAWQQWRSRRSQASPEPARLDLAAVAALKQALVIRPAAYGAMPEEPIAQVLTPAELLQYRDRPWAQTLATTLQGELRRLQATAAPRLATVCGAYIRVFADLSKVPERGLLWGTRRGSGVTTRSLEESLAQADAQLAALEDEVGMRADFLRRAGADDSAAEAAPQAGFDEPVRIGADEDLREERSRYMDSIEALIDDGGGRDGAGQGVDDGR